MRKIKRSKLFTLFLTQSRWVTLIHTVFVTLHEGEKKWLQKSFSQKPLRKLLRWQTNTLGAPSSREFLFFFLLFLLRGQYFIFKTSESVLRTTSKIKSAFGSASLAEQKDWYRGMYTSMQKYREGPRSQNRPSLLAKDGGRYVFFKTSIWF